jgi:hypothetical protein
MPGHSVKHGELPGLKGLSQRLTGVGGRDGQSWVAAGTGAAGGGSSGGGAEPEAGGACCRREEWDGLGGYLGYLDACRSLAARLAVALHTLDRALWQWSKNGYPSP